MHLFCTFDQFLCFLKIQPMTLAMLINWTSRFIWYYGCPYPECVLVTTLRLAALRISLSKVLTIWENLGLKFLSLTQQSNMSWCKAVGQSMGGGSL